MFCRRVLTMTLGGLVAAWLALLAIPALALSGADVANLINQRYRNTPSKCFVNSPVYECSGVLLRTAPRDGAGGNFWRLSADDAAAGYAELSYARQDLPRVDPPDTVGFVLADRPTAAGDGKPYALVCGCPPVQSPLPPCTPCPANASAAGVSLWNASAPASLAVQAIYYDVAAGGQLAQAVRYQKQYFDGTGQWVPILKASIGDGAATAFGFDERDQLDWGYAVAKQLEARYLDTRITCPGNLPGYDCSGVLIRNTGFGTAFHAWNPSPNSVSRNGVSFSYARVDMNMTLTTGGVGIIMRELSAPAQHPVIWRCAFPVNAVTAQRPDSCSTEGDARLCDALGITTAAQYLATWANGNGCGLAPSAAQFGVLVDLRKSFVDKHNEVILAAWPQDIPTQIPLESLFYTGAENLPGTEYVQQDYMAVTGRFMPIVSVTLSAAPGAIFTYDPGQQDGALLPGARFIAPGSRSTNLHWWNSEY
ncbi:hypothetical protein PIN31009_04345 [Pandoraea iniqua]|uniref:hypothetical protein n=1 Tax=Pandoraea iniqua TaxID=2508288 RepID=UPI0012426168|nr:hypothetical protein [Pandoraea iniqua]VVE45495.1 hypothetical protein PIN31009_04345 [Pandoraea iniqua]